MAVNEPARFDDGNRGKRAVGDVGVQAAGAGNVGKVRGADSRVGHDGGVVLKRIANVAVLIGILDGKTGSVIGRTDRSVIEAVFVFRDTQRRIARIVVPLIAVILPGDAMGVKVIANAGRGGGRNGENRVGRAGIQEGILALAEIAGIVIVQEIVVPFFAARIDFEGLQVIHDGSDSGLTGIRAVAVRASTVRRRATGAGAVAILGIPIVGAHGGIGIFDLVQAHAVCRAGGDLMRRNRGMPVAVAEPDHVAVTEHDVVGAGAAVDGLVEVIAHGVVVGEGLEVGCVALLDVIEAEGGGAFAGEGGFGNSGQVIGGKAGRRIAVGGAEWRLLGAVCARPHRDLDPGKQLGVATGGILRIGAL